MTDLENDIFEECGEGAGAEASPATGAGGAVAEADAAETTTEAAASRKPRKGRTALIVVGIVLLVLIGGGATVYATQHNNPAFCNAVCHSPMDPYVASYQDGVSVNSEQASEDILLSVTVHKQAGEASGSSITCLTCHEATLNEQVTEGIHWVTGDYTEPLEPLALVSGTPLEGEKDGAAFCLRAECHAGISSSQELVQATNVGLRNPHKSPHGKYEDCSGCHQMHEQSINACVYCHPDAPMPEGWARPKSTPDF